MPSIFFRFCREYLYHIIFQIKALCFQTFEFQWNESAHVSSQSNPTGNQVFYKHNESPVLFNGSITGRPSLSQLQSITPYKCLQLNKCTAPVEGFELNMQGMHKLWLEWGYTVCVGNLPASSCHHLPLSHT